MLQAGGECPELINEVRLQQQEGLVNAVPGTVQRVHAPRIRIVRVVDKLDAFAVPGFQGHEMFSEMSRDNHNSLNADAQQT